ncbi:MAG: hypothetical protein V4581_14995 [Bacteroidota bacterium]
MKQLTYAAIAFFVLFAAQAQTVTEIDLLGTWNVSFATLQGSTINFKTGEIHLSNEAAAEIEAKGQDLEEAKKGIITEIGPLFKEMYVEFKPGLIMDLNVPGAQKNTTYTLKEVSGTTYIVRNDGKEINFTLKDGVLNLSNPEVASSVLSFEKKK